MASFKFCLTIILLVLLNDTSGDLYVYYHGKDIGQLPEGEPIKIIEGHDLLLECVSSRQNSSFVWTKDGAQSSFENQRKVTYVQEIDKGRYNCKATSYDKTYNQEIIENKSVVVEILYSPSYPMIEPSGWISSLFSSVLNGEVITLRCDSNANPKPNYEWRIHSKTGAIISRESTYQLTVESYTIYYYCIVRNQMVPTIGEAITTSVIGYLKIDPTIKARIYKIEGGIYKNVNEGDALTVICSTYGRPPAKVWWTKAGDSTFYHENDRLSEVAVNKKFTGIYFCNAENSVTLFNRSHIKISVKEKVYITVHANSKFNMDTKTNNRSKEICSDMVEEETANNSKNTALFIFMGLGWFGFVLSVLFHVIICTRNQSKKRDTAMRSASFTNEPLSAASAYTNHVRIPASCSGSSMYDEIKPRSLSVVSAAMSDSNDTVLTSVSSCPIISENDSYLHPQSQ